MKKIIFIVLFLFILLLGVIYFCNRGKSIPILMYHAVSDETFGDESLFVSIDNFNSQMKYLKDNGYTPIFLSEIDNIDDIDKPIIITFDDGYKNVYDNAYPILNKYNFKANVYLISGWLDGQTYMSNDMVIEMSNSNNIEFGSHTVSHIMLGNESYETQLEELTNSKNTIENILNKKVNTIAFPYGSYNKDTIKIASTLYDYSLTTKSGFNYSNIMNNYKLKRFNIERDTSILEFESILTQ